MIYFLKCRGTEEEFQTLQYFHHLCMKKAVEKTFGPWSDDFQKKLLRDKYQKNYSSLLFMMQEGQCIGTINMKKNNDGIFIENFYIHPNEQGKGWGKKILSDIKENCHLYCLKKEKKVIKFYQKNGFIIDKEDEYFLYMKRFID